MESQPFEAENPPSRILLIREVMEREEERFETRSFVSHSTRGNPAASVVYFPRARIERASACVRQTRGGQRE